MPQQMDGAEKNGDEKQRVGDAEIASDKFGQLYAVEGAMLNRYSSEGELQYNYNNRSFGTGVGHDLTQPVGVDAHIARQGRIDGLMLPLPARLVQIRVRINQRIGAPKRAVRM